MFERPVRIVTRRRTQQREQKLGLQQNVFATRQRHRQKSAGLASQDWTRQIRLDSRVILTSREFRLPQSRLDWRVRLGLASPDWTRQSRLDWTRKSLMTQSSRVASSDFHSRRDRTGLASQTGTRESRLDSRVQNFLHALLCVTVQSVPYDEIYYLLLVVYSLETVRETQPPVCYK